MLTRFLPYFPLLPKYLHLVHCASTGVVPRLQMTFLLNHRPVDALALIVHASGVEETGRSWVEKLCTSTPPHSCASLCPAVLTGRLWGRLAVKIIPRQLFEVPIQAAVGNTIIARRTLSALRADVTAGLYGGASQPVLLPSFLVLTARRRQGTTSAS